MDALTMFVGVTLVIWLVQIIYWAWRVMRYKPPIVGSGNVKPKEYMETNSDENTTSTR